MRTANDAICVIILSLLAFYHVDGKNDHSRKVKTAIGPVEYISLPSP